MGKIDCDEIKNILRKWKGKDGNLIMILHEIQNRYGYVPRNISLEVAQEIGIPLARIYEVITFYNYFQLTPPAKNSISVCLGTACYLNGAPAILEEIKSQLHVQEGQSTEDGQFQLHIVRCVGCCGLSPVININGRIFGNVKKSEVREILSIYKHEEDRVKV
ncbi:MAG TPA: NAD(P)H-dependent oxidoreductase subunit E [Dehalococcoidales bacterium]|nr:NAD(P)H-dependent oxidoreductase subunit E [Dehalococcoidales bacterium]